MKRSTVAILVLLILLVGSNGWWAYAVVDQGVTASFQEMAHSDRRIALRQMLAILPIAASPSGSREDVIAAAIKAADDRETFEKDGRVWVGRLGLRFSAEGRLVDAVPSWDPVE